MVIKPSSIPKLSFMTLAKGARQLVVHDALLGVKKMSQVARGYIKTGQVFLRRINNNNVSVRVCRDIEHVGSLESTEEA